jgi:alpha-galactosidase
MEPAPVRHGHPPAHPARPEVLAGTASFAQVNPFAEPMDHRTTSAEPDAVASKRKRCWHRLTLAQCLVALLAVEGVLLSSKRSAAWAATPALGTALPDGAVRAEGPVKPEGVQQKNEWIKHHLLELNDPRLPFSFVFGGKPSDELLATWPKKAENRKLDVARTQYTITWTDPTAGLEVRCVAVDYADYPAIEWTAYFKNAQSSNTPILEDIDGLDANFQGGDECEFVLHGIKGDWCAAESYEPYHLTLGANATRKFAPASSGKSCDGPDGWPYYNLQMPGGGVILAVGWPGQWRSSFQRDQNRGLRIQAGQELTHLSLKPGEEIRTPLIAMLFWQGTDVVAAQNLWRRWYIAHNMPRVDGRPQAPVTQVQVLGTEKDTAYVNRFLEAGIRPDLCWRDAGAGGTTWYPSTTGPYRGGDSWLNTGTWDIDPAQYPKGFKPFSDWAHAHGMQFVLWFEPERVGNPDSWLGKNHPEWLLPGTSHGALLNEGNPAALNWLIDHVDGMIKSQGLDWYREDMNGAGPLPAWRRNDAEDRQGITENLYVQGHLAFWDELRRRNRGLRIDSCASGGRRNDLETMRRAVPLLRSDFQFPNMKDVVEGNQGHTYGLSFWLPFQGTGTYSYDPYSYRSFYLPSFGMGGLRPENVAAQKQAYEECRRIAPYMLGDYYPLTSYSLQLDHWIAWQFNRPETGDGVVQAFRRAKCDAQAMAFRLSGLDQASQYEVTDLDAAVPARASGKELMETGLTVEIKGQPGAAVIVYKRVSTVHHPTSQ